MSESPRITPTYGHSANILQLLPIVAPEARVPGRPIRIISVWEHDGRIGSCEELAAWIQDAVWRLTGRREIAVFALQEDGFRLNHIGGRWTASPALLRTLGLMHGRIAAVTREGHADFDGIRPHDGEVPYEDELEACVPLRTQNRPLGALAVYGGPGLELSESDRSILLAIGREAGAILAGLNCGGAMDSVA